MLLFKPIDSKHIKGDGGSLNVCLFLLCVFFEDTGDLAMTRSGYFFFVMLSLNFEKKPFNNPAFAKINPREKFS